MFWHWALIRSVANRDETRDESQVGQSKRMVSGGSRKRDAGTNVRRSPALAELDTGEILVDEVAGYFSGMQLDFRCGDDDIWWRDRQPWTMDQAHIARMDLSTPLPFPFPWPIPISRLS